MEEDFSNSQQTDREKLTQDIERLKLAVRNTSVTRTCYDYSDSEDEALRITEAGGEGAEGDELHSRDGYFNDKSGQSQRHYAEEAIHGISQDSLGSTGSLDFGNSLEICLAFNREYQEWIKRNLMRIQIVLDHNRQCQMEVKQDLQNSSEKNSLSSKRKTLTAYSKPFFKTADGSFPPPNEESLKKRFSNELDAFVRPPKTWSGSERNKLRESVQADRLQRALRPFMMRKEIEHDRLKTVLPDSEEEQQIKDKIADLNSKIKTVRETTDITSMYGDLEDVESIDWMKIANFDFEASRTPDSCKLFWVNAAHPSIAVSKWTSAEDAKLIELVSRFGGVHWEEIARCLGTNRSAFMCLQRYQTKLNPCLQTGKWTPEEDDFLKEVVNNYKRGDSIPWSTVAYYVEGRSREQCARRWEQLHPKSFRKGRWTSEEDDKLAEAARLFGVNKWWKIKEFVPGRTAAQCRERWKNTLDQTIHFGEWKYEEDKKLWLIVQELGAGHWQRIARDYLPGRTDNMCLQRYRRLLHWYQANKAREKMRRRWKSNIPWRRWSDKQFMKRKQLEKIVYHVKKEEAQEKATMSALCYIGEVSEEYKETGNDGQKANSEIAEDEDVLPQVDSGYQLESCEMEAIQEDLKQGIFIPRPSTRSFASKNGMILKRINLRNVIRRHVKRQVWMERRSSSRLRKQLENFVQGEQTAASSRPHQARPWSQSNDSTVSEPNDLSDEAAAVDPEQTSSVAQQPGRSRQSEEEADVEHKIAVLISEEMAAAKGLRKKHLGENSSSTASQPPSNEDLQEKTVNILCRALNFQRCANLMSTATQPSSQSVSSSQSSNSGQSSSQSTEADDLAKASSSVSSEQSLVLLVKKAPRDSSSSVVRLGDPPSASKALDSIPITPSDPRLSAALGQGACGRAVLQGAQAKIYSMPSLPPSCSMLNGFKTLLLNRAKLMSIAGKFQIPGIISVSSSEKDRPGVKTEDIKTEMNETGSSLMDDSKVSTSPENQSPDNTRSYDKDLEVRSLQDIDSQFGSGTTVKSRTKPFMKQRRQRRRYQKPCQPQIVKSNLRSRRVLAAIHGSHDYHMFRSRFLSSFLWPAFLSTVPVKEVKCSPLLNMAEATETNDAEANDAASVPSNEEQEQDYSVDGCSSDDDDWSKMHYKKRTSNPGRTTVYKRWMRKSQRARENTRMEAVEMNNSVSDDVMCSIQLSSADVSCGDDLASQTKRKQSRHIKPYIVIQPRKSLRLAEKKDMQQKTQNQESVIALGCQQVLRDESDGNLSTSSTKCRKIKSEKPDDEGIKQISANLGKATAAITSDETCDDAANDNCAKVASYLLPYTGSSSQPDPSLFSSGAFLQNVVDENGYMQTFVMNSDGTVQPVLLNSSGFASSVMDFAGDSISSDPTSNQTTAVSASSFVQPVVIGINESSVGDSSDLCKTDAVVLGSLEAGNMLQSELRTTSMDAFRPNVLSDMPSSEFLNSNVSDMDVDAADDDSAFERKITNFGQNVHREISHNSCSDLDVRTNLSALRNDNSCNPFAEQNSGYQNAQISNLDMLARATDLVEKSLNKDTYFHVHKADHCSCLGHFNDSSSLPECTSVMTTDASEAVAFDVKASVSSSILLSESKGMVYDSLSDSVCTTAVAETNNVSDIVQSICEDHISSTNVDLCRQVSKERFATPPCTDTCNSEAMTVNRPDSNITDSVGSTCGAIGTISFAETAPNYAMLTGADETESKMSGSNNLENENGTKMFGLETKGVLTSRAEAAAAAYWPNSAMHFASNQLTGNSCSPSCQHIHGPTNTQGMLPNMCNMGVNNSGFGTMMPMIENLTAVAVQKLIVMLLSQLLTSTQSFNTPMVNSILQPIGCGMHAAARLPQGGGCMNCGNSNCIPQSAGMQMAEPSVSAIHGVHCCCGLASGGVQNAGTSTPPSSRMHIEPDGQHVGGTHVGDCMSCNNDNTNGCGFRNSHLQGYSSHPVLADASLNLSAQLPGLQAACNNLFPVDTGWSGMPLIGNNPGSFQFHNLQQQMQQIQSLMAAVGMPSGVAVAGMSDLPFNSQMLCQSPMLNQQQWRSVPLLNLLQQQQNLSTSGDSFVHSNPLTGSTIDDQSRIQLQPSVESDARTSSTSEVIVSHSQMVPRSSNVCGEVTSQGGNQYLGETFPIRHSPHDAESQLAVSLPDGHSAGNGLKNSVSECSVEMADESLVMAPSANAANSTHHTGT